MGRGRKPKQLKKFGVEIKHVKDMEFRKNEKIVILKLSDKTTIILMDIENIKISNNKLEIDYYKEVKI